jgi:UDP-glucose:(heptosyl)LPS alpha-1,3-glucosyltransferase
MNRLNMRIALVILHADPARGGAERYTVDLAAALAGTGHDVSLLAGSFADVPAGVSPIRLDHSGVTRVGRYRRFLKSLEEQTPPGRFDIVHAMLPVRRCDIYHPHAGIAAEAAAGSLRHRLNRRRAYFAAVEKRLLDGDHPPVVLSLSDVIGRVVEKWYPNLPPVRRVKLFNGVDTGKFRPALDDAEKLGLRSKFGLSQDATLALMIAQDFERKGLGPAIEALAAVDARVRLVVAGRDDQTPFRQLATRLNVAGRIDWIGPTDDPASLYRAVDFFVLPTSHDPCSLVVLESLASGVPVITTVANGASEIIEIGLHGVILNDSAASPLAAAMGRLADATIRLAMSGECRTLRDLLSSHHHLTRLLEVYETVLTNRRPSVSAEPAGAMEI